LEVKITTESIGFGGEGDASREALTRKRMLLYKHDDDLRQEAFAVQFINTCDAILKASGLDMKLLSFQCIPVGARRGFVEWVPGSVPLSEICQPVNSTATTPVNSERPSIIDTKYQSTPSKAGLTKYESLRRLGGQQNGTFRQKSGQPNVGQQGSFANNPIQDYLRSVAFDPTAPYMIRKNVMDTYIKSAAGYSVVTYILGVGDRHLDNLLLHQSGAFFHCDFSFILGSDPKTYLPVRVTEDMIHGMGGLESDNYARFLSAVGASFLVLRRPENTRLLLSMVRLLEFSCIPDISENQRADQAVFGMRDRLRLELSDQDAVSFIENLVESSQASKMWMAVDVIHNFFR
jgi:phosphatidylinositol 3-kinase